MASNVTQIVLQNEFAIINGNEATKSRARTSKPKQCVVFTLYDKTSKLGVLGHFDEYTSIASSIWQINEELTRKFNAPFSKCEFTAKVMGGTEEAYSAEQKRVLTETLKNHNIAVEVIFLYADLQLRPQVELNALTGEVKFLEREEINTRLEYLQLREYGEWNNFLDRHYGDLPGSQIPYFKAKVAARNENDIPSFKAEGTDYVRIAQLLESAKMFKLPIQEYREAVSTLEKVIDTLKKRIENPSHLKTLEEGNYNFLLRQMAAQPDQFDLLRYLLEQRHVLKIDLSARGATSGTALDVAEKFNNKKGLQLLKTYIALPFERVTS